MCFILNTYFNSDFIECVYSKILNISAYTIKYDSTHRR